MAVRAYNDIRRRIQELEESTNAKVDFFREYTQFLIRKAGTVKTVDDEGKVYKVESFFGNPDGAGGTTYVPENLVKIENKLKELGVVNENRSLQQVLDDLTLL